jgi:glutaconate CoA-transferase subunit B
VANICEASVSSYTTSEMMTVAAARRLINGAVCFVGIGLPSTAANLARLTHAPEVVLIYESGPIGAKPTVLPLSIGDGELSETADTVVSTSEIFRYWLQSGRIDVGFLGAAQIDRFANINTTVIGPYAKPQTRLPGAGGAPEIAANAKEVFIIVRHSARAFVSTLDFITSVGYLDGGDARSRLGLPGKGPMAVITDLCTMEPDCVSKELTVMSIHPGVTRAQIQKATGWPVRFAAAVLETPIPDAVELKVLRDLQARTAAAHGTTLAASD